MRSYRKRNTTRPTDATFSAPSTVKRVSLPPPTLEVDETPPPPAPNRRSRQRSLVEWLIVIVVGPRLAVNTHLRFSNVFHTFGSMEPTLQIGDRIIVNKLSVEFGTIHTGDILVFKAPRS